LEVTDFILTFLFQGVNLFLSTLGIGEYIQLSEEWMTTNNVNNNLVAFGETNGTTSTSSFFDRRSTFLSFEILDNVVMVNSANPQVISEAILALAVNPPLARRLGETARRSLNPYFTVERQMQQYENLYDSIYEQS
jgi:hypothetical protein